MYHTDRGTRTLEGAEANLIRNLLANTWDLIDMLPDERWEFGVGPFDRLTRGQQLSLLVTAGEALLDPSVPDPPLTAALEGAVAAMFEALRLCIDGEMQTADPHDRSTLWRELALAALNEIDEPVGPTLHRTPDDEDPEHWDIALEVLRSAILWDEDYCDEDIYDDDTTLMEAMDIEADYFRFRPKNPTQAEFKKLEKRLKALYSQAK